MLARLERGPDPYCHNCRKGINNMITPPPPDVQHNGLQTYLDWARRESAQHDEHRRLKREIELKKLQMELAGLAETPKPVRSKRRSIDTYEAQITEWFDRLPPAARAAPRTMAEFINLLEGRTPGMRAHAPDVSRVLSRLSWVRKRVWRADGEGRRVWLPPSLPRGLPTIPFL